MDTLRSIRLPVEVTSRLVDCSWRRNLTLTQKTTSPTPPRLARLKMGAQGLIYFGRFNSLVLVVEGIRSNLPSPAARVMLSRICAASMCSSEPPRSHACSALHSTFCFILDVYTVSLSCCRSGDSPLQWAISSFNKSGVAAYLRSFGARE